MAKCYRQIPFESPKKIKEWNPEQCAFVQKYFYTASQTFVESHIYILQSTFSPKKSFVPDAISTNNLVYLTFMVQKICHSLKIMRTIEHKSQFHIHNILQCLCKVCL